MSKKKEGVVEVATDSVEPTAVELPAEPPAEPTPLFTEPTPAPPEPTPIDDVSKAMAEVVSEPGYVQTSAEHLEVRTIRKLVEELGWEVRRAEVEVRARLS